MDDDLMTSCTDYGKTFFFNITYTTSRVQEQHIFFIDIIGTNIAVNTRRHIHHILSADINAVVNAVNKEMF